MRLQDLKVINDTNNTNTTENALDTILNGERVQPLQEGIFEVTVEGVRSFSKGIELTVRNHADKKLYKCVLWLDVLTQGDYLKTHLNNLFEQIGYKGTDLNPNNLINQDIVLMQYRNNGFLNTVTNIYRIAKVYQEEQRAEEEQN